MTFVSRGFIQYTFIVETAGLSLLALLYAVVVLAVVVEGSAGGGPLARWFGHPALRWLGKYSYGIYVYNYLIYLATVGPARAFIEGREGAARPALRFAYMALGLALSAAAARLSWSVLESPLLELKRFFTARREWRAQPRSPAAPAGSGV